jgi:hypothetical protein
MGAVENESIERRSCYTKIEVSCIRLELQVQRGSSIGNVGQSGYLL